VGREKERERERERERKKEKEKEEEMVMNATVCISSRMNSSACALHDKRHC
jgi:hypothetical protein